MKRIRNYVLVIGMMAALPLVAQIGYPPACDDPCFRAGSSCYQGEAARMQYDLQGAAIMAQNTAVWTEDGLIVLQGNRLLFYDRNLCLRHQTTLPVLSVNDVACTSLQSMLPTQLLPTDDGLIVVRGRQIIRIDSAFRPVYQACLPELDPMTCAELATTCALCLRVPMVPMTSTAVLGTQENFFGTCPCCPTSPPIL